MLSVEKHLFLLELGQEINLVIRAWIHLSEAFFYSLLKLPL